VKDVEEYPYGRFASVLDGEGNRIELWEPPAGEGPPLGGVRRCLPPSPPTPPPARPGP
jgi:hypothetical protein